MASEHNNVEAGRRGGKNEEGGKDHHLRNTAAQEEGIVHNAFMSQPARAGRPRRRAPKMREATSEEWLQFRPRREEKRRREEEAKSKTRGKCAAKGKALARRLFPTLPRGATFCRASGARRSGRTLLRSETHEWLGAPEGCWAEPLRDINHSIHASILGRGIQMSVDFAIAGKADKQGLREGSACSENVRLNLAVADARIWCRWRDAALRPPRRAQCKRVLKRGGVSE